MKVWILGGTADASRFVRKTKNRDLVVTVATEEGTEFLPADIDVRVGRLSEADMCRFIADAQIEAVLDFTHPFAKVATHTAKRAAAAAEISYYRYVRPRVDGFGDMRFSSYADCARALKEMTGTFFFTTGSNEAARFQAVRGENRFVYRIIPSEESLHKLKACGVETADIVAMLGPFDYEMNVALFRHYRPAYLVTKNSGEGSGFCDKMRAAADCGMRTLVIETEVESGYDFEEMLKIAEGDRRG